MARLQEDQTDSFRISLQYVLLIIAGMLLLLGIVVFALLPPELPIREYRTPVLSFLAALAVTAIGNIVVGFIQKGVSKEARKALQDPIESLDSAVDKLRQIQVFYEAGVVAVHPNRSSAMRQFRGELEREDRFINFVGTSMLGSIDPSEENEEKTAMHRLLLNKRRNGVQIRVLLMHPAYGEFRERVENRERAAVARDIQGTLRYLLKDPIPNLISGYTGSAAESTSTDLETFLDLQHVRLYPGVITAFAIFTSRSLLVNVSTLHGPVFNNFAIIIEDTEDPTSLYKRFREEHFEAPWRSEKTVSLDSTAERPRILEKLLDIDFGNISSRFSEGDWPATIPVEESGRQTFSTTKPPTQ